MIHLENLELGYVTRKHTVSVFREISAQFNPGDLVGLMRDNGIGKSTLLKTITGNLTPLHGKVTLFDKEVNKYTAQELSRQLSIVVTEKLGGFNLTVWDIVASGRTPYI